MKENEQIAEVKEKEVKESVSNEQIINDAGMGDLSEEMKVDIKVATENTTPFVPDKDPRKAMEDDLFEEFDDDDDGDDGDDDIVKNTSKKYSEETEGELKFDYEDSDLETARMALIQLDKIMSFGLSIYSKEDDWQKYRIRQTGSPHSSDSVDYELLALATMMKTYKVKFPVESIFIGCLLMGYAGSGMKAHKDKAKNTKKTKSNKETKK